MDLGLCLLDLEFHGVESVSDKCVHIDLLDVEGSAAEAGKLQEAREEFFHFRYASTDKTESFGDIVIEKRLDSLADAFGVGQVEVLPQALAGFVEFFPKTMDVDEGATEVMAGGVEDHFQFAVLVPEGAVKSFELLLETDSLVDIGDESFESSGSLLGVEDSASLLPDPSHFSLGSVYSVGELEGPILFNGLLDIIPDVGAIGGIDDIGVGDGVIMDKIGGLVSGEFKCTFADEFHGPVFVVEAAICHSRKVAQ